MEYALRDAKARFSAQVAAAESGERVVLTRHGKPVVELVRCRKRGGIDFSALEHDRRQLGLEEEREGWPAEFDDPAFSRRALGLDDA